MKRRNNKACMVCFLAFFFLLSCSSSSDSLFGIEERDIPQSSPALEGMDQDKMEEVSLQAEKLEDISSLLIARNGAIVMENYYHGAGRDTEFNVKSVSKSIISALTGIAVREKLISGLEQRVADFFPEYFVPVTDPRKRELTIRHLLTMTTGFEWIENGPVVQAWVSSGDWVRFFIDLPLASAPGEAFNYTTGGCHVLSALIARAAGMSTLDFGNKYLFQRTGIKVRRWDRDPQGYYFGGAELYLTARDMVKFGLLYVNGGTADGKQVVPSDWVQESTRIHMDYGGTPGKEGYGYLWWVRQAGEVEMYYASGAGGQFIFIIPDLKMVVVTTSALANSGDQSRLRNHYISIMGLLDSQIIPAATN